MCNILKKASRFLLSSKVDKMMVDTNKSKPIIQILKLQKMGGILLALKHDKKLTKSLKIQKVEK